MKIDIPSMIEIKRIAKEEKETKAKLNNGEIVVYHACSLMRHPKDYKHFNYLGRGVIYSFGGDVQNNKRLYYFFVRNSRHKLYGL